MNNSNGLVIGMSDWSAKNPYMTTISQNFVLNGESSQKETRHIVFELKDSGLNYKAGDALAVIPRCPPELADEILLATNFSGDEEVETHLGSCMLRDALTDRFEIHRVSKKWIEGLANRAPEDSAQVKISITSRKRYSSKDGTLLLDWAGSGSEGDLPEGYVEVGPVGESYATLLSELTSDSKAMEDYIWSRDYIDSISDFGGIGFTPQQLVDGMDRLKPRLYSIASSPDFEKGTVHLTVAIVRYSHHGRGRAGLCTGFMADECETNSTEVGVFMSPTRSFVLPADGSKDIIMVGP